MPCFFFLEVADFLLLEDFICSVIRWSNRRNLYSTYVLRIRRGSLSIRKLITITDVSLQATLPDSSLLIKSKWSPLWRCNEFTLSVAKKILALCSDSFKYGESRATSDRRPKTIDQILPSPRLFCPSKN